MKTTVQLAGSPFECEINYAARSRVESRINAGAAPGQRITLFNAFQNATTEHMEAILFGYSTRRKIELVDVQRLIGQHIDEQHRDLQPIMNDLFRATLKSGVLGKQWTDEQIEQMLPRSEEDADPQ